MAEKENKQKKPAGKLSKFRRAFLKAVLGSAVIFGTYQVAAPDPIKDQVAATLTEVFGPRAAYADRAMELDFTLLDQSPAILGSTGNAIFETQDNHMTEWYAALGRHQMLMAQPDNRAAFEEFLQPLDSMRDASIEEKARAVDALVDRMITYQLDSEHYGGTHGEYWASPLETINDRRGDCEDFAILKYFGLRYLDVEADRLFVITVGPPSEDRLNHAVLAVDIRDAANDASGTPPARNFVILNNDGSRNGLLTPENSDRYKLYAAYSEAGIWSVPQPPRPPAPKPEPTPTPSPCTCSVSPS